MATRIGTSFADLINFLEAALGGLKSSTGDAVQKRYATDIAKILPELRKLDDRQEKAKAELYTVTKALTAKDKEARAMGARMVSYLESVYGKSGPELQKYGFSRRQHGGGRKKKTA
ncbi:hypothetical protein HY768_11460 [candidate division TA06 bacterium]|uniref:Uncharacterized protein n=1 Tax=candidate division TA06 bacterium TaxID=2250710 RepID=A0A933IDH4_UNCT6|nr:hypothetical protein [candidate division TA06 bacterium]